MNKIKRISYLNPGQPEFVEGIKTPPDKNQVGIDIIASSLCNSSELRSFKGGYSNGYGTVYPMKSGEPGHEAVGVVSVLGKNISGFDIGDYVAMTGHGGDPCHSSYVNRNSNDIAKVYPGSRDIAEASVLEMYGCAYHCALTPLTENEYIGEKVLIIGMGAMGLCSVQLLKNVQSCEITAVDISHDRLITAKESGADIASAPNDIIKTGKYDIVIECSGSVKGQELAFESAPKILIFSSYNTNEIRIRQNLLFDANTTIYNPGVLTSKSFKAVAEIYNKGLIRPDLLISKRIKPNKDEYLATIEEIKTGRIIKALMEWM